MTARQLRLGLDRPVSHAREAFIVSDCNRAALALIDAWPAWPAHSLVLVGPAGSGKSHLAAIWRQRSGARQVGPGQRPSGPALLEDADDSLDDEWLFHLLNRAEAGDSLLITARTTPAAWPARLPDLRSRLNALTAVSLDPPDDAVLAGVMEKLFSERNIRPRPDVIGYAIRRIERSVPSAQELVVRIDELAQAERLEVTVSLVRTVLDLARMGPVSGP